MGVAATSEAMWCVTSSWIQQLEIILCHAVRDVRHFVLCARQACRRLIVLTGTAVRICRIPLIAGLNLSNIPQSMAVRVCTFSALVYQDPRSGFGYRFLPFRVAFGLVQPPRPVFAPVPLPDPSCFLIPFAMMGSCRLILISSPSLSSSIGAPTTPQISSFINWNSSRTRKSVSVCSGSFHQQSVCF